MKRIEIVSTIIFAILLLALIIFGCKDRLIRPKEGKIISSNVEMVRDWILGNRKEEKKIVFLTEEKPQKNTLRYSNGIERAVAARDGRNYERDRIRDLARDMVGEEQFICLDKLITRESGYSLSVVNQSSGAAGLFQKISGFDKDYKIDDAESQLDWGIRHYIPERYGDSCGAWSFWQSHNWY